MTISSQLVADYKLQKQITSTDAARDLRIGCIVDGVIDLCQRYTGRILENGSTTSETQNYNNNGVYFLQRTPITSFTSVSFVDFAGQATALPTTAYKYNADTGEIRVMLADTSVSNAFLLGIDEDVNEDHSNFSSIRFSYTGGLTSSNLPAGLKMNLLMAVDDIYSGIQYGASVNHQGDAKLGEMSFVWKSESEMNMLCRRYFLPYKQGGCL